MKECEDDREASNAGLYDEKHTGASPPQSADDESDIESLHSFHYSPKAVDLPSAVRLAKRLYSLDGFKKSDVSRHLGKKYVNNFASEKYEDLEQRDRFQGVTLFFLDFQQRF